MPARADSFVWAGALNAAWISSRLATIVLYGSGGGASSTRGVPSVWQKRMLSSKVFWQVGHRFIFTFLECEVRKGRRFMGHKLHEKTALFVRKHWKTYTVF